MSKEVHGCSHPTCYKTSKEHTIYLEQVDYGDGNETFTTCEEHCIHANVIETFE